MKNKFKEQKAVILCNGPSLNDVDFSLLEGVTTFGLNKINLLFDRTTFRPSFIVAVNPLVIEQNREFYESTNIPIFLDAANSHGRLKYKPNHFHLCCYENGFSKNAAHFISQGGTVTFVAMQLAYFMGFSRVALVGCDHHFSDSGTPHETLLCGKQDSNHFDQRYFANQIWHAPDLFQSEASYRTAHIAYQMDQRKIINASKKTDLTVFQKMDLREFIKHA